MTMNDIEAIGLVMERANALTKNAAVRRQAVAMWRSGKSRQEIQSFVIRVAIATLYGKH